MDDSTSLLLQRVAVLRSQLNREKTLPSPETLETLIDGMERSIERADTEKQSLARARDTLLHQQHELVRKNEALALQRESLEKQKENLERQVKTLERHNTHLLRQNERLERYNAALEEARLALDAEKRRYRDLFEFAPDAFLLTDHKGNILSANRAAAIMLKASPREIKGEPLIQYITPRHQKLFNTLLKHLQRIQDIELAVQPRMGQPIDTSLTLSTITDDTGEPVQLLWMLRDISERQQAMSALNASERRFRTIFNEAILGILLLDRDSKIVRANRAFQEMLGYSEEELLNRPIADLACPEDAPIGNIWLLLPEDRQGHYFLENRFRRRDGQYIWASLSLSALRGDQGQPIALIAMVKDITREKQASAELTEMRRRLLESGETERLRLAQELHDGPTQDLYAASFLISNFAGQAGDSALVKGLKDLQEMLKGVANTLRDLVGELRPPTLGNLGLEGAIRSHAQRVHEMQPGLDLKLHLTKDGKTLPAHTRLAFFRIYQQSISNVLRHAQATQAVIAFHVNQQEITLDVWDNGKGFEMPARMVDLLRDGHYGLAGIAERVQALGGALKVETRPGSGTLIHVTAPLEPAIPVTGGDPHLKF